MNDELAGLLREAGVLARLTWSDCIIVQNLAPIPPVSMQSADPLRNRGFNLVILAGRQPRFFCKCRPACDAALARETQMRSLLAQDDAGGLWVPTARSAASTRIAVQVSPFVRGTPYEYLVARQELPAYLHTLRTVLEGAGALSRRASDQIGDLLGPATPTPLRAATEQSLHAAAAAGAIDGKLVEALTEALARAGDIASLPQHGDLWDRNLLIANGRPCLIDFESYGEVRVPLYDALHLVFTTTFTRARGRGDCLERLRSATPESRGCRALLAERAAADGLSPEQEDGVLTFYLADMAASLLRRNADGTFSAPYLADLRRTAELLAAGERGLLAHH